VRGWRGGIGDEADEGFRIAVGDVDANVVDRAAGAAHHALELVEIAPGNAERIERVRFRLERLEERDEFVAAIMLVQRGREAEARERARHFERADRIHVRRDHRDAAKAPAGVLEDEFARDVDFRARGQGRALRADQDVPEVELDVAVDVHGESGWRIGEPGLFNHRSGKCGIPEPWECRQEFPTDC
jgi:hypothetical protein